MRKKKSPHCEETFSHIISKTIKLSIINATKTSPQAMIPFAFFFPFIPYSLSTQATAAPIIEIERSGIEMAFETVFIVTIHSENAVAVKNAANISLEGLCIYGPKCSFQYSSFVKYCIFI